MSFTSRIAQGGQSSGLNELNRLRSVYARSIIALVPLLLFLIVVNLLGDGGSSLVGFFRAAAPVYYAAVLLFAAQRILRINAMSIWTPIFWIPVVSAVYFGIGPLVEVFGNETTQSALDSHRLAVTSLELVRVHLLCTMSVMALMGGVWLHMMLVPSVWARAVTRTGLAVSRPVIEPARLALIFVIGGAVFRYLIIKPSQWGMLDISIPGVLSAASYTLDLGFGLMAFVAARREGSWRPLLIALLSVHVFLTVLGFAKAELVIALLFPALGAYIAHRKMRRLALNVGFIVGAFMIAQPYVSYARAEVWLETGTISQASYQRRLGILRDYVVNGGPDAVFEVTERRQGWWTRLNFAGPQAFAMNAYDKGLRGDSLDGVWTMFIPRAIWPDKPIYQGPGGAFYSLVTGREATSFLALSVYGDLYWQFGWLGVLIGCPLIGWYFAMLSWRSLLVIKTREFLFMPAVLIALQAAMQGLTKYVANGIVASIPIYIAYWIFCLMVLRVLASMRRPKRHPRFRAEQSFMQRRVSNLQS